MSSDKKSCVVCNLPRCNMGLQYGTTTALHQLKLLLKHRQGQQQDFNALS